MIRQRRRAPLAVAAVALGAVAFAGCSTDPEPENGSQTPPEEVSQTITWYVNETGNLTRSLYEDIVSAFEDEYPNITVQIATNGGQDYTAYLQTLVSAGNAPDVVQATSLNEDNISNYATLNNLEWAQDAVAEGGVALAGTFGDDIYAVPVSYQIQSLFFYNKDLFAEAGIDSTPASWEELEEAAAKLQAAGVYPLASSDTWVPVSQLRMMVYPQLITQGNDWWIQRSADEVTFVGSSWETELDRFKEWIDSEYIRPDALGLTYDTVTSNFISGDYGMYLMGSWVEGNVAAATDPADIGVFGVPASDGTGEAPLWLTASFGWSILSSTEELDASQTFVEFLGTDTDAITALVSADGSFSDLVEYDMSPLAQEIQDFARDHAKEVFEIGANVPPTGWLEEAEQQTQRTFTGETGGEIAEALDAWWAANVSE